MKFPVSVVLVGVQLEPPPQSEQPTVYERAVRLVPVFRANTVWMSGEETKVLEFQATSPIARGWTLHVVGSALITRVTVGGRYVEFDGSSPVVICKNVLQVADLVRVHVRCWSPA